jgi:hypothetical protein
MPITRANVEIILVRRVGRLMTAASLDGTTISGSNADLNDPICDALLTLGYSVTNITAVVDADVAQVTAAKTKRFLALAELRALENILGNLDLVNIRVGPRAEELHQLAEQVETAIERKKTELKRITALSGGAPFAGGISKSDKDTQEEDIDRTQPAFRRDLHRNERVLTSDDEEC